MSDAMSKYLHNKIKIFLIVYTFVFISCWKIYLFYMCRFWHVWPVEDGWLPKDLWIEVIRMEHGTLPIHLSVMKQLEYIGTIKLIPPSYVIFVIGFSSVNNASSWRRY